MVVAGERLPICEEGGCATRLAYLGWAFGGLGVACWVLVWLGLVGFGLVLRLMMAFEKCSHD